MINPQSKIKDTSNNLYLFEDIDVGALRSMEKKGSSDELIDYINKVTSFLTKQKYDEASVIRKNIKKCNQLLDSIKKEKKKVKNHEHDSSYKFTASYIIGLSTSITTNLIIPIALNSYGKAALGAADLINKDITNDIENLNLSITDYNKLLDYYEDKITNIKSDYEKKLIMIKSGNLEDTNMRSLREFKEIPVTDPKSTTFVSPKEIESKYTNPGNVKLPENREVLHDDDVEADAPIQQSEEKTIEPQKPVFTPYDAMNKYKCDPKNVPLAKYKDKYYLTYGDLKNYMDRTNSVNYRDTVDTIIKVNDTPDLNNDNLSVIMSASELENCSIAERTRLENADVTFEIYK